MPHRYSSSDDTHAMVARIAPAIIKLLSDGLPRSRHEMVEALAPADGRTQYFLHDHNGSLDYAWSHYGGSPTRALEYVASHQDLIVAFGANADAGRLHFERQGSIEERGITFDGLDYIASHGDLISAFGSNEAAGASHFITAGHREGRATTFDAEQYLDNYADLRATFGDDTGAATDNPHLFRDAVATSIALDDPEHVRSAAPVLGHASFASTERDYRMSRGADATRVLHDVMEALTSDEDD